MSCLNMANQKISIIALDGFWSMQMFSYSCVSHHNTVKLELLQLVFPSILYVLVCSVCGLEENLYLCEENPFKQAFCGASRP